LGVFGGSIGEDGGVDGLAAVSGAALPVESAATELVSQPMP
jgi:hypothetical protein